MTKHGANGVSPSVRFGDFEADLHTGELYRRRKRIKLAEQPLTILALLLENPGVLVTREEMHAKLWPEKTYVDFDQSLNTAVGALRRALRDSPRRPRFIETLPKRGYRFIAEVERIEPHTRNGSAPDQPEVGSRARRVLALLGLIGLPAALIWGAAVAFGPADAAAPTYAQELVKAFPPGRAHVSGAISPDGLRFARRDGDDGRLFIEDLRTGESRLLVDDPVLPKMVWSPDGSEIALIRERGGDHLLEPIDVASGESRLLLRTPAPATILEYHRLIAWDGVGNRLLLLSMGGDWAASLSLKTLDLTALDLHGRLTRHVALSPDGRFLASALQHTIDILRTDGSEEPVRFRVFDGRAVFPAWSSDGATLFFMRRFRNSYKAEVWSAAFDREAGSLVGEPSLVAPLATVIGAIQPVVTQGGDYVWAHQDSLFRAQVFEVDPESGEPRGDVVVDFHRGTRARSWSPSGSTLFVADISLNWQLRDFDLLRRYDVLAASEDIYQVPRFSGTTWYSRDFSKAVSVDWAGKGYEGFTINLIEVESGDSTEVMFSDGRLGAARLSDNADSIAFLEGWPAGQRTIGIVDVASGSVRRLYDGDKLWVPNWSPDGRELAVADRPCVIILDVESDEAETLACYPEPPEADARVRTASPHWSPDGSRLLWSALNPVLRRHEIWVLDRSTGTHRVIWTGEEDYKTETAHARWSSDGRYIAFTLIDNPPVEIWKLRHPMLTPETPSVSD